MSISDRLDEIEARASRATEGPWEADFSEEDNYSVKRAGTEWIDGLAFAHGTANAEFMAASRTDLPELVEAVRRRDAALQAVLEAHAPIETGVDLGYGRREPDYCPTCSEYHPCSTWALIATALGEES